MCDRSYSRKLCLWLNQINPRSEEETAVILYGLQLMVENIAKLILIQLVGCFAGSGTETLIVLLTFCGLRLQAGGWHAKTNIGCTISMAVVVMGSVIGSRYVSLSTAWLVMICLVCVIIVVLCAPRSINLDCFTVGAVRWKKIKALLFFSVCMLIAWLRPDVRELIVFSVVVESATLLPKISV